MALYHLSVKIISRSSGQSACAAAAYRSGEKITDGFDGITHDYRHKENVEYSVVMLPENAPADFADRQTLWNAVEQNEKQGNAQLAREIEFSLPRELPPEVQKQIALEFLQEHCVKEGMVVDVSFHNPPKMNSKKIPVDALGRVTRNPEKYVYENPHCHALCTMRPLNDMGKWENKRQKLYVCEKDGIERKLTAEQIKQNPGWEKQFYYERPNGQKEYHTKTYVEAHPEEGLKQVNRYPRSETIVNETVRKWNSTEFLVSIREAWAEKVNEAYAAYQMKLSIDHRSYKEQGLDLIPTIHEGKNVIIAEKKLLEEFQNKIAAGEPAVLKHTDIRSINLAIKEHNEEVKMISNLKKLRSQMKMIIAPVKERIFAINQSLANQLEQLRTEIIILSIKIRHAIDLKNGADSKILMGQNYLKDIEPVNQENISELCHEKNTLLTEYKQLGILSKKKKEQIVSKINQIDQEISFHIDNIKYAKEASSELEKLQGISIRTERTIKTLKTEQTQKKQQYQFTLESIPPEKKEQVYSECLMIRKQLNVKLPTDISPVEYQEEANVFDGHRFQQEAKWTF